MKLQRRKQHLGISGKNFRIILSCPESRKLSADSIESYLPKAQKCVSVKFQSSEDWQLQRRHAF